MTAGHITDAVVDMLDADQKLSDDAKLLVLAALEGDGPLTEALEGAYAPLPHRQPSVDQDSETKPAGAFVKSIQARGFRGIGPTSKLDLVPAPGLTIVAGRNGSGKSSFSDALELALTGETYRWNKRNSKQSSVWAQHWRNLHAGRPCEIRIEIAEEGAGSTTIGVDWSEGAALAERKVWVQRDGKPREPGLGSLSWGRAVELNQPILSYDELGGLLEAEPSRLFDKLGGILGIEQATDTERRLGNALKTLHETDRAAKAEVRELKKVLATLNDERAAQAYDLVRRHRPDLDAVEAIATGTTSEPASDLAKLKAVMHLRVPTRDIVVAAVTALREASEQFERAAVAAVVTAERRTTLLREALDFHRHRGDGPCPVCGEGMLDTAWRQRTQSELAAEDSELSAHRQAYLTLEQTRAKARSLLRGVEEPAQPGRFELQQFPAAHAAWRRWSQEPEDSLTLAEHIESSFDALESAFGGLRAEAETLVREHEDTWAPYASRLASWVQLARRAREEEPTVELVQNAYRFIQKAVEWLRDRELEQLTETAHDVWAALKAESNVDLGKIKLAGSNTRRHVELHAAVDGEDAQALGVMSQGELHALALALFLPRATVVGSPFQFVVLDDPIQAMDPAKIDGFVRILAGFAEERQVVVFSHDDRLPQIVRQMGIDARILEVCRDASSAVHVVATLDPARRYIDDAFAVAKDPAVPADVKAKILPGICRMAVESAARDTFLVRHLGAGEPHAEVESTWQDAQTTSQRLALTIHGDKRADLTSWLDGTPGRRSGFKTVTRGAHEGIRKDPLNAIREAERIVQDLQARA